MKRLYHNNIVSSIHSDLLNQRKESFIEHIKNQIAYGLTRYMMKNNLVNITEIKNEDGSSVFRGGITIISSEEVKSLKHCYNVLSHYEDDPFLRDVKEKIEKILWEE